MGQIYNPNYSTGGGGGATIPATTNLIKGDGAGNGADSGITISGSPGLVGINYTAATNLTVTSLGIGYTGDYVSGAITSELTIGSRTTSSRTLTLVAFNGQTAPILDAMDHFGNSVLQIPLTGAVSFGNGIATQSITFNNGTVYRLESSGTSLRFINGGSGGIPIIMNSDNSVYIASASASALTAGPNGATNPSFQVDASTASSATGVQVIATAAGATTGPILQSISSGTNEAITLRSKGTGTTFLDTGSSTAAISFRFAGGTRASYLTAGFTFTPSTTSVASQIRFSYVAAADTNLTTAVEAPCVYWNLGATRTHATGDITIQRDFRITGTAHAAAGASIITDLAALAVEAGSAGASVTATNIHGLYIPSTAATSTGVATNSYALTVNALTGATNNYAAQFSGLVGYNTSAPTHTITLGSTATGYVHYNTSDQTTNYQRIRNFWTGTTYTIAAENAGSAGAVNINLTNGGKALTIASGPVTGTGGTFQFNGGSAGTGNILTVNGTYSTSTGSLGLMNVFATLTQTSTAGYTAILANITESTLGSGAKNLMLLQIAGATKFGVDNAGHPTFDATNTASGTTGAQTINKPSGTVNFAAAATSLVVTNSTCTTSSIVHCVLRTADATARIASVVPAAGSFTINLTAAATAETSCGFLVMN